MQVPAEQQLQVHVTQYAREYWQLYCPNIHRQVDAEDVEEFLQAVLCNERDMTAVAFDMIATNLQCWAPVEVLGSRLYRCEDKPPVSQVLEDALGTMHAAYVGAARGECTSSENAWRTAYMHAVLPALVNLRRAVHLLSSVDCQLWLNFRRGRPHLA